MARLLTPTLHPKYLPVSGSVDISQRQRQLAQCCGPVAAVLDRVWILWLLTQRDGADHLDQSSRQSTRPRQARTGTGRWIDRSHVLQDLGQRPLRKVRHLREHLRSWITAVSVLSDEESVGYVKRVLLSVDGRDS